MRVASVSKLNGRSTSVAGSSLSTSTNTRIAAVSSVPRMIGRWTRPSVRLGERPSERAARSMLSVILPRLASTALKLMVRKRVRYA